MTEYVEIKGLKQLEKRLMEIPGELAEKEKVVQKAAKAGAMVVRKRARELAPKKRGILRRDIRLKLTKKAKRRTAIYDVGVQKIRGRYGRFRKGAAHHAHLVEFGTKPHIIKVKKAKGLGEKGQYGRVVKHPGARPHPFIRPAFEQTQQQVIRAIKHELAKGIKALGKK